MKQLLAVIILCALAAATVAGDVEIHTASQPSQRALEVEQEWDSARTLLAYLLSSAADESCVASEGSAIFLTPRAVACVFENPIDGGWILFATIENGQYWADNILLLKDSAFYAVAAELDDNSQTALILHELPPGTYELIFILGAGEDLERIPFYFQIHDFQGDD